MKRAVKKKTGKTNNERKINKAEKHKKEKR